MARLTLRTLLCSILVATAAQAQGDPAEAEPPVVEDPAAAEPQRDAQADGDEDAAQPSTAARPEASLEERRIHQLRQLEARLSVGQTLSADEQRLLRQVAVRGETPRARALAAAILPWLPPEDAASALLAAADDADPRVRDQALQGLVAISRRLEGDSVRRVEQVATERLMDPSAEVACAAARVLAGVAPDRAAAEIRRLSPEVEDVRYACWRRLVPMPEREVTVAPPPEPPSAKDTDDDREEPPPLAPARAAPPNGDLLFLSTAAATGFLAGGLLPGLFSPPRDTLLYSPRRTVHAREEPSIVVAGGSALAGALLLGGAAFGATTLLDPLEVPAATSTALGTAAGAIAGLGGGMAFGLDGSLTGLASIGGGLTGLALSSALAFTVPPASNDLGLALGLAGTGAIAATLISLAAVPVGVEQVIGDSTRVDFALGTGLLTGGVLGVGGLLLAPIVDVSPGRVLVASAAGASAAGLGLGLTYLFTPVNVGVRERIASGVGAGLHIVTTTATFVLLPGSWADAIVGEDGGPPATTALFLDEGKLRLGVPVVSFVPPGELGVAAVAVPVLGGRF